MPVRNVRRRYLHFRVDSALPLNEKDIWDATKDSVDSLFGLKGLSDAELTLVGYDEKAATGILRCRHTEVRRVRASLAFLTLIKGQAAAIRVDRVSGTIRRIKKKTGYGEP